MYGFQDMECNRILSHFGPFFVLLPLLTTQKIKILKKGKKWLEISSFCKTIPKIMIICFIVPVTDVIFTFHFGLFFTLPRNSPKNQNFKKMKNVPVEISSFCTFVPKIRIR